jgi:hypothetical protein
MLCFAELQTTALRMRFDTKQVSKPTSDTLMGTPKTSILQPATRYPVGQATSDSKGSSTPGLTYSPNG